MHYFLYVQNKICRRGSDEGNGGFHVSPIDVALKDSAYIGWGGWQQVRCMVDCG